MLKNRLDAANAVAASFLETETAVDRAALMAANCVATMLVQRSRARLPVGTALDAIQLVSDAAADLVRARQKMIEAHRALAVAREEIGLRRITSYGDQSECPPVEGSAAERGSPRLAAVG